MESNIIGSWFHNFFFFKLILHGSVAISLWKSLFGIFLECEACLKTLDKVLRTKFVGFGRSTKGRVWGLDIVLY